MNESTISERLATTERRLPALPPRALEEHNPLPDEDPDAVYAVISDTALTPQKVSTCAH